MDGTDGMEDGGRPRKRRAQQVFKAASFAQCLRWWVTKENRVVHPTVRGGVVPSKGEARHRSGETLNIGMNDEKSGQGKNGGQKYAVNVTRSYTYDMR